MRFGYLTSLVEQIVNLKQKGFTADHKTNIVLKLLHFSQIVINFYADSESIHV